MNFIQRWDNFKNSNILNRYHSTAVVLIFCLAAILRFYQPDQYPLFVNADELSNIYDGYSMAETGKDRAAESYFVVVKGAGSGDYRPSLMAWLLACQFKLFGFSVLKGRIFAGVLGMISLVLLYLFSKKIGGKDFAIVALLLATLSPWHIIFSRIAHEGTMLPSIFLLLILLCWKKSREKKYSLLSLALLGFVTGFSVNAYQATRLTGLLIAILIGVDVIMTCGIRKSISQIGVLVLSVGIGALPQLIFWIERPDLFLARAENVTLPYHSLPDFLLRFFENIFKDINPAYLFFSFGNLNVFTVARLLPIEAPFFLIGLILLKRIIKPDRFPSIFFYFLLFICLVPAAITTYNPHDLRASAFMILAPMISAAGIMCVVNFFKSVSHRRITYSLILIAAIVNAGIFIFLYSRSYEMRNNFQQHEMVVLAEKIGEKEKDYDKIFIQGFGNQPYLYLTVFTGIPPDEFQKMEKKLVLWGIYYQLGKFYFPDKDEIKTEFQKKSDEKRLFVYAEKRDDFPALDSVFTPDLGWMYFYKK